MLFPIAVVHAAEPCADPARADADAAQLHAWYEISESLREPRAAGDRKVLVADEERAAEVWRLDAAGRLCTPVAKWEAAWLLTQADGLDRLERAHQLAIEAMKARAPRSAWLTAFTFDLMRTAQGNPQRYATQRTRTPTGKVCVVRNEEGVSDEERAKYGLPPFADTWREVLDASGFTADAPTVERLDVRDLICEPVPAKKGR